MAKILFIAAHRPNRSPSQRYRFEQYFDVLTKAGHSFHLAYLIDEADDFYFYNTGYFLRKIYIFLKSFVKRWQHIVLAKQFDYVFIQREAFMTGTTLFERRLKRIGKPLIFDFDDAIWKMDVSEGNKHLAWLKKPSKTNELLALADIVVAGNEYLKAYAAQYNSNVKLIPTTIDTDFHRPGKNKEPKHRLIIGWSGSNTTIKHFRNLEPVLLKIKAKYGDKVQFIVYGCTNYKHQALGINGIKWTPDTEVDIINTFDIGLMPLPDDEWSKGKCGLKGLSYMACEVATIMSAVGVNIEIIQHGDNGLLAKNDEAWLDAMTQLIEDSEMRIRLAKAGRVSVEMHYSKNAHADAFVNLFK